MNRWRIAGVVALMPVLALSAAARGAEPLDGLDKALAAVAVWEDGKDSGPLRTVETVVFGAVTDPQLRGAVEDMLISTLTQSKSRPGRAFICRQLRTIGTGKCVPALAALLTDRELSFMARYALGRIEDPTAAAALHQALGKTAGKLQAGMIISLASKRYTRALPDIARLVRSPNAVVADAAVKALGWLGGDDAVKALQAARPAANRELALEIDGALMTCAEGYIQAGRKDDAAAIYRAYYTPKHPRHIRLGALAGLAAALGEKAAPLIAEAVKSNDPQIRASAIASIAMVKGADATKAFVAMLPTLPPEGQVLVLRSLGARGDSSAAGAVRKAAQSDNQAVRVAAIEALGSVGDASCVGLLVKLASAGGAQQAVARASLRRLGGTGSDDALIASLRAGDTKVRIEVIRALTARRSRQAVGALAKAATDDDASVRREAIGAMGSLADEKDLPRLVALLIKPKDPGDRAAIEQAIGTAFLAIDDRQKRAAGVLAAMNGATDEIKPMLLRLLGRAATPKALAAVRAAMKDRNPEVSSTAARTLAGWPDASIADEVLALARTSGNATHKVLFLRGYVRMAGMSSNPTAMYIKAMDLAKRPDDKKLVLAGLGSASSGEALRIAMRYVSDSQLRDEAALAAVQIAGRIGNLEAAYAKQSIKGILAVVKDKSVRAKANEILNEMDKYEGYIMAWVTSGPYKGKDVFGTAFPPEKGDGSSAKWQPLNKGLGKWDVNLEGMFGAMDHCSAYMRTSVWSPVDQAVRLELGSDDGLKVWVNGKKLHSTNGSRGLSARQDIVKAKLVKGWNVLMLEVNDHAGGWAFCCRIRNHEGAAVDGLKVEAK